MQFGILDDFDDSKKPGRVPSNNGSLFLRPEGAMSPDELNAHGDVPDAVDSRNRKQREAVLRSVVSVAMPALQMATSLNGGVSEEELFAALRAAYRGLRFRTAENGHASHIDAERATDGAFGFGPAGKAR